MATLTTNETEQLVQKLKAIVDQLMSLQGVDRRMNGYLKQRSKAHIFKVISAVTGLALDASELAKPPPRVHFSKAQRAAVEAYANGYFVALNKPKKLAA